jgi:electron transfer flavoprotein alpha subunit
VFKVNVLVIAEIRDGAISRGTLEVLNVARMLCGENRGRVVAACIGNNLKALGPQLIGYGADEVAVADAPSLAQYNPDSFLKAVEVISSQVGAEVILLPGSLRGNELAPRIGFRLGGGTVCDCIELNWDEAKGRFVAVKPVYGGKALSRVTARPPQVFTIRPRVSDPAAADASRRGDVREIEVSPEPASQVTVKDFIADQTEGVDIEDADVVVAGGRGVGGEAPFREELAELAAIFGGAVGASRVAVDSGWAAPSCQVGQTGKKIGPNLYFAIGISGASQHVAGITSAKHIVAINKDQEAPIFGVAEIGVVEDCRKILRPLIDRLKATRG